MTFTSDRSYKSKKTDWKKQSKEAAKQATPRIKYENLPRLPPERAAAVHAPAITRGARCAECPLYGLRAGPVMGTIVPEGKLTVIGEAPGENEIDQKRPFCLVPTTQVLFADLTWRPLGDVRVGDEILTIEEHSNLATGISGRGGRRWVVATVTATHRSVRPTIKVQTSQGCLVGTADHRALTCSAKGSPKWVELGAMTPATKSSYRATNIVFYTQPWALNQAREAGWLAGFLDGEGHVEGSKKRSSKSNLVVGFSQNEGPTLERARGACKAFGFALSIVSKSEFRTNVCWRENIAGGVGESFRALGTLRPTRLLNDYQNLIRTFKKQARLTTARVETLEDVEVQEVVDITTTAGTFIANGFVVHNCGKSGDELNAALLDGGIAREDCTVTNVLLCRPPEEMKAFEFRLKLMHDLAIERAKELGLPEPAPPATPYECCLPRLRRDLSEGGTKNMLAVGAFALRAVADIKNVATGAKKVKAGEVRISSLKKQIGAPVTFADGDVMVASYHPAFAMRPGSRQYKHIVRAHIRRAAEIARRGYVDWKEPKYILDPNVETVERVLASMRGKKKTIDIETDKGTRRGPDGKPTGEFDPFSCRIRCIGFGTKDKDGTETVIVVPIRHMDGTEWWDAESKKRIIAACMEALNDETPDENGDPATLIGHNLSFDTSVLLRFKLLLRRDREYDDCHVDSETEFLTAQGWKRYDDVEATDLMGSFDGKGKLEWHPYTERVKKPLTRDAYVFETERMRCVVTGNHWMWVRPEWRSSGREGEWGYRRAEDLLTSTPDTYQMLSACASDDSYAASVVVDGVEVTEDFCRLLGLVISDGCVAHSADAPRALHISQEEDGRATPMLLTLQKVFGLTKGHSTHHEDWRAEPKVEEAWRLCDSHLAATVVRWVGRYAAQKHLPTFALTLPSNLRRALLEGLMAGDGSKPRTAELYRSSSKRLVDEVQALALSLGVSTLVHRDGEGWAASMRPDLGRITKIVTRLGGRRAYGRVTKETFINDFMVCFTVPPHNTLITRSRNKPAFASNTMLLHHDTPDNDLPHDLGFVGARYFEVPSWKSGADDKYYDNVTDYDLHLYNARDVLTTMRLYFVLMDEIFRYDTVDQYELDRKLAPVARDMGELGLFVDERKRGELSLRMNEEAFSRLKRLKEITKDPKFNPASTPQIRRFLFVEKKLKPEVNTRGKDWQDGEDPSTNTAALTKMTGQPGVDQQTKDFINTLLEYRAYMKLKGTYIDKLRVHYPDWKKQFGLDIDMVPEVWGPVWKKYKKKPDPDNPTAPSKYSIAAERWPVEWTAAIEPVAKGLDKEARRSATRMRTERINALLDRVEDGVWEEALIIPARPALSRLHTTYKIHIIPSGRMSTSPAVQNWPKFGKANMHEMIVAPPGHVMVGADLDQVELRLYAAIAGDKLLLQAFRDNLDPHSYNAASLFAKSFGKSIMETYLWIVGLPAMHAGLYAKAYINQAQKTLPATALDELTARGVTLDSITHELTAKVLKAIDKKKPKEVYEELGLPLGLVEAFAAGAKTGDKEKKKLRGYAKTFAYLETYGGEAEKLYGFMSTARDKGTGALMFPDLREQDVQEWHDQWHKTHPETRAWQEACQRTARLEGYTATPIGSYRKRFFMGGPNKPGATFNHVIQGAAAEIANAALLKIAKAIPYQCWSPFTGLCLQVHDYIGVYVPKAYAEQAIRIIEDALNSYHPTERPTGTGMSLGNGIRITATAVASEGLATQ